MKLSIVIPSYNRLEALLLCLESLSQQSLATNLFEIIIIDDGSDNDQQKLIETLFLKYKLEGYYYRQTNSGPAKARNKGIKMAKNEIILLIGDDMLVETDLLKNHYEFHLTNPESSQALLGRVVWSDKIILNDFMDWLERTSFQFDFKSLTDNKLVDYKHFYTSNISLKKDFLINNGLFNESFPFAAFEDTELGYRLIKKGLKLIYRSQALVYHHHEINFSDYLKRMERAGRSAAILVSLHPDIKKEIAPSNKLKRKIKSLLCLALRCLNYFWKNQKITEFYWRENLLKKYSYGYRQEQKNLSYHPQSERP